MSLTVAALHYKNHSRVLNPDNIGQSRLNIYLGKPFRVIARIIYTGIALTIIPIIGVIYNGIKVLDDYITKNSVENQKAHEIKIENDLKALKIDATVLGIDLAIVILALSLFSVSSLFFRHSAHVTDGDQAGFGYGFGVMTFLSILGLPFLFKFAPQEVRNEF